MQCPTVHLTEQAKITMRKLMWIVTGGVRIKDLKYFRQLISTVVVCGSRAYGWGVGSDDRHPSSEPLSLRPNLDTVEQVLYVHRYVHIISQRNRHGILNPR